MESNNAYTNLAERFQSLRLLDSSSSSNLKNRVQIQECNPQLLSDLLTKGQTLLGLCLFRKSLGAADKVLEESSSSGDDEAFLLDPLLTNLRVKSVELRAKSLFGLGRYGEGVEFLSQEIKALKSSLFLSTTPESFSHKRHFQRWKYLVERGRMLQGQKSRGDIDMSLFVPNRRARLDVDGIVEYQAPCIEVGVVIPGKGRGVLALDDIPKGKLLLSCRATEIIFDTEDEDDDLEVSIAQRMRLDPDLIPEVYQLHAGNNLGSVTQRKPGFTQIDMDRIVGLCTMNSFGNSRNSSGYGHNSRGLWVAGSYFNHDCIAFNCLWKVLGDFLFVRTSVDVKRGEELTISYTDSAEPLEERVKFFQAHDFICACALCKYQREHSSPQVQTILDKLGALEEGSNRNLPLDDQITLAEGYLAQLEEIRASSPKPQWEFSPHVALDLLCKLYLSQGNSVKYKKVAERYYFVVNCSGTNHDDSLLEVGRGPCLEVGAAGQVASVFLKAGDLDGALKWVRILRQDLSLIYGKGEVLKRLYPQLYAQALKYGLNSY